jgi:YgiT-type zinc finger domain-containing protein
MVCKSTIEEKNTPFMVDINNCILIVKNVPSQVCKQCGDVTYAHKVVKNLETLLDSMESNLNEITVTNYSATIDSQDVAA